MESDGEELTSPEPIGVGTTVRTRLTSMGKQYEYTWTKSSAHEPPHSMKVESTAGPIATALIFTSTAVTTRP